MPRPKLPPDLVTYRGVTAATTLAPRTIRRYAQQGRITKYRVGPRAVRFDLREIRKLIVADNLVTAVKPADEDEGGDPTAGDDPTQTAA